jgi:hypothetical protein
MDGNLLGPRCTGEMSRVKLQEAGLFVGHAFFDWFRAGAPENDSTQSPRLMSTVLREIRSWPPR